MEKIIQNSINQHKDSLKNLESNVEVIKKIASIFIESLEQGGKIIFIGNGGSAADSQHFAAELIGRFKENRHSLAALALTTDTSIITAVGNDFGFDEIFSRQVEGLAGRKDVLVGISTSGNSKNVIKAIEKAKSMKLKTVGMLGSEKGILSSIVDVPFIVPSVATPRIQEIHSLAGHIICEIVEAHFTNK